MKSPLCLPVSCSGTGVDAFLDRFFYYSFTTMTTLGSGDITPVSHPARYFSAFQALM